MDVLEVGDEIRCVRCGQWHSVFTKPTGGAVSGAADLDRWLWFKCSQADGLFFGGRVGEPPGAPQRWRRFITAAV